MPDQTCGDPKLPAGGGAPDVGTATGVLGVAHGGTGADMSSAAQAKVLATPPGATGPVALRSLAAEHLPDVPVSKGGTGVATAAAGRAFMGPASGADAAPGFRAIVAADLSGISLLTAAFLFFPPVGFGVGVGWSQIAGGYVWGTSWQALRDTTITNIRAYCADASGTLHLKLWVGGVAVASGTVAVTGAGVYTLATAFSYVVPAGTTFTVSAYATAEVAGIPYFSNTYFANYPAIAAPTLLLTNPRLYGSGNVEPGSTSSNYIFGVEPVVGA